MESLKLIFIIIFSEITSEACGTLTDLCKLDANDLPNSPTRE